MGTNGRLSKVRYFGKRWNAGDIIMMLAVKCGKDCVYLPMPRWKCWLVLIGELSYYIAWSQLLPTIDNTKRRILEVHNLLYDKS